MIVLNNDRVLDAVKTLHTEMMAEVKKIKAQMSLIQNQQEKILNKVNFSVEGSLQISDVDEKFKLPINNDEMYENLLKQIEDKNTRNALVSYRR